MVPSDTDWAPQPWQQRSGVSDTVTAARSDTPSPQRRNDESWVEISSQPSSSSLSSIGDEIVTTGLRVRAGNSSSQPRRRRPSQQAAMPSTLIVNQAGVHAGTSSQEEYDETESEEDRLMTSSTEQMRPSLSLARQQTAYRTAAETDSDSDDDENATALGPPSNSPTFRPQPNAFSHPPSHLTHRHSTSSAHQYNPSMARPSMPTRSHTRPHRTPNFMSPSYQADNDAALRASLTTLLSCAAAARGLPKADDMRAGPFGIGGIGAGAGVIPSSQPMELRLVPESELTTDTPPPPTGGPPGLAKVPLRTASNSSAPSAPASASSREKEISPANAERTKRMAATQSKSQRATKKKRTSSSTEMVDGETVPFISPTLLTWVVSAGVVVLISVVGFGAGYVIGREVGRQEGAAMGLGPASPAAAASSASASCGREVVRSTPSGTLRRFRWGSVGKSVTA
ncbi:hypothetical protein B0H66DRAFT_47603 [Apodospora peruviana]|uniref:Uncharacterized protein n=1 Tax=Apodospora peruviana TaxID=516989 RepID=A0AAE0MFB7_9PEZI|nr:hypothetical protein B0H66DRAFT_47603 [Apodospora peruviana]